MAPISPTDFEADLLSRKGFVQKLERYLLIDHKYVDGGLVASLEGPFGSGKSTTIRMWNNDLESRAKDDKELPVPIILNAWESDYCGDPLVALVSSLIEALRLRELDKPDVDKIREAVSDIGWFGAGLLNQIIANFSGIDVISAGEFAEEKKADKGGKEWDAIMAYEKRPSALNDLKGLLREMFEGENPKVIFMIDELDRCRPDYAVRYLETIKHIFDIDGLIFVLSIDNRQMESAVKALYGENMDFPEYFRRFVHRRISLPDLEERAVSNMVESYIKHFIDGNGRVSMIGFEEYGRSSNLKEILLGLRMYPRQIQETFRIIGHATECGRESRGNLRWCYAAATCMLAAFKVARPNVFDGIAKRNLTDLQVGEFLINELSLNGRDRDWWFSLYITGTGVGVEEKMVVELSKKLGIWGDDTVTGDVGRTLEQFNRGWGVPASNQIVRICKIIEETALFTNER